jgi:peptidoglycan/LPS O-acetylase OafA/YrhL
LAAPSPHRPAVVERPLQAGLAAHVPELDGVRGIAILLVLLFHSARNLFRIGWIGVDLFFVLSGFLITTGLLGAAGKPHYFRDFFTKRALRIWPVYYLLLVYTFLFSPGSATHPVATSEWFVYGLFVQNFVHPLVTRSELGNMWSLAIEEQFYLIWPFVVWLVPRRALARVCVALIVGSLALRLSLPSLGAPDWFMYYAVPCRLDPLAFGALLSVLVSDGDTARAQLRKLALPSLCVGGALSLVLALWLHPEAVNGVIPGPSQLGRALVFSTLALAGFGLIGVALLYQNRSATRLLRSRWLSYLGQVSYGLYVYHAVVFDVVHNAIGQLTHSEHATVRLLRAGLGIGLSVLVATLSWYGLERRVLRLKGWLLGQRPAPSHASASAVPSTPAQ